MGNVTVAFAVCLYVRRNVNVMEWDAMPRYVRKTVIPSLIYLSVRSTATVIKESVICHYVKRAVIATEANVVCQNVQKTAALRMENLPWVLVKAIVTTTNWNNCISLRACLFSSYICF